MNRWTSICIGLACTLLQACGGAQTKEKKPEFDSIALARPKPILVKGVGFASPAAVIYDSAADVYLVSNVNGEPTEKDDNGFISQVSPAGKVLNLKWIDGSSNKATLHAPKGMAVTDTRLFVADIDVIRIFNRKTGVAMGAMRVPGASYLNGMSIAPNGTLYVSDSGFKQGQSGFEPSGSDAVYRVSKWGALKRLFKGEELDRPTGLAADDRGVWVASWLQAELYRITSAGKREDPVRAPSAKLQGLVRMPDGAILVASEQTQTIYIGYPGSTFSPAVQHEPTAGGLGYDFRRRRVLIPNRKDGVLVIQGLSGFEQTDNSFDAD